MDIKNKKGWVAQDYVVALILFSTIVGLLYVGIGSLATDYQTPGIVDESFSKNYNQLNNNTALVSEMLSASSSSEGLSLWGTAEVFLKSSISIISLIFGSLKTMGLQILSIGTDFGVPTEISSIVLVALLSIITVIIIFIIVNFVNRTNKI